jgi:hypothetical protein
MTVSVDAVIDALLEMRSPGDLFEGCTDAEREAIRADQRVSLLPREYDRFLERVGRRAGTFLRGTDAFIRNYLAEIERTRAAGRRRRRRASWSLVIGMHQGYQFYWFPSILEENPEVFMYQEGSGIVREWSDLADCLIAHQESLWYLRER